MEPAELELNSRAQPRGRDTEVCRAAGSALYARGLVPVATRLRDLKG